MKLPILLSLVAALAAAAAQAQTRGAAQTGYPNLSVRPGGNTSVGNGMNRNSGAVVIRPQTQVRTNSIGYPPTYRTVPAATTNQPAVVISGTGSARQFHRGYGNGIHAPNDASHWDSRYDHVWNHRRYRWSGQTWFILDSDPYYYASEGPLEIRTTIEPGIAPAAVEPVDPVQELRTDSLGKDIQRALGKAGYYKGPVDGVLGPATRAAIGEYQADHGMEATGRMTQELIAQLGL